MMGAILRAQIEQALDDLIDHEDGSRFQSLGVILATQKCDKLVAHEKKADLGLDGYVSGGEFPDSRGRGVACSLTATLSKVKGDIEEAQKEFKDLGVLYFVTPNQVGEKRKRKEERWVQEVKREYGVTLIVMSREHVITTLLSPGNEVLCANHLYIHVDIPPAIEQTLEAARQAIADVNASWKARVEGEPLIELSAHRLTSQAQETDAVVELAEFEDLLLQGLRMTMEAPAGRGKTTTLTQIAERRAVAGTLTFLVHLPAWAQGAPDILEFIAGMEPFRTRSVDATMLGRLYRSQPVIFLLNGWNEIADSDLERATTGLETLARDYRSAGILVATRVRQATPPLPGTTVRTRLKLLTRKQRAEYVARRTPDISAALLSKLDHDPVLDELTRTPFFLSRVVSIAAAGQDVPNSKMGVLHEIIRLLENDPTYHAILQSSPLHGEAGSFLTPIAAEMTSKGRTRLSEVEVRQLLIRTLRRMREQDQIDGTFTGNQVLEALTARHVLERMEYPHSAYQFEHQQLQEYYAAEFLKAELQRLLADPDVPLHQVAATDAARTLQKQYVNQSAWSEPLYMLAGDLAVESLSDGSDRVAIRSASLLLDLAIPVDLIFAAELFRLSSAPAQDHASDKLSASIRGLWVSPENHRRSYALTAMTATGSDLFRDELIPVLKDFGNHARFEVYHSTIALRLSSLGPDWQREVRNWEEEARLHFASAILHIAAPLRELAAFVLSDPSVTVRARAFKDLMRVNTDADTTRLLAEVDDETFETAIAGAPLRMVHPIFRSRALEVYKKILRDSVDPENRYIAAANAVLLGQADAHSVLMDYLDGCSAERVRALAQRELRSLLEALSSDSAWRSAFVIRNVRAGALAAADWSVFITTIEEGLKEALLARLETEDLFSVRLPGVQGLLRVSADAALTERIFRRVVSLHESIRAANEVRSLENIAQSQQLAAIERQLQDFLWSLPLQTTADGALAALSPELSLNELSVFVELWKGGRDTNPELDEVLSETSLQAIRGYLKDSVPHLTNDNDPRGELRAYLALAISRVGDPEDISDIEVLMAADVERIQLGLAARARREHTPLAEGSVMRYTNQYIQAIRHLKSESEGALLAKLLSEPFFELEVAWALVAWARTTDLPSTARIEGWATRTRNLEEIWEARSAAGIKGFDEDRRAEAVGYLRQHIEELRQSEAGIPNEEPVVWRLKGLARPLAVVDGRSSSTLILDILALPLKTHGTLDAWKVLPTLEVLLFAGAILPNDRTFALVALYVDQLTSKWQSDNDLSLVGIALGVLPFVEDSSSGIATLADYLDRIRLRSEALRRVVTALGHSRREEAVGLLLSIIRVDESIQRFGQEWLDAMAVLDNARSREILLSVIDPTIPGIQGLNIVRLDVVLAPRIAEAAQRHPAMKSKILALCNASLDPSRRELLAEVIVHLNDERALLASLNLLDDESGPELPYRLQNAIEEAFVERIPDGDRSNQYTLQPRTATELRERLIAMTKSDPKRKQSALRLLGLIESWRLSYGRPSGESRNPLVDSDMAWPPRDFGSETEDAQCDRLGLR